MTETYYVIRHKKSGELMPQMKRRGYSHWNPSSPTELFASMGVPRLIDTRRKAHKCIIEWAKNPNARNGGYQSSLDGEWIDDIDIKDDGRKKDDLEVIEVQLVIPECQAKAG